MHSDGKSLLQRWGIEPTVKVWIGGNDIEARGEIEAIVDSFRAPPEAAIDGAFITPDDADEAAHFAKKLIPRLVPGAAVWVTCRANDSNEVSSISSALADMGFVEFGRVPFSKKYTTIGFRKRL